MSNDAALDNVILCLRIHEAKELYDLIGILLESNDFNRHEHVNDASYEHEFTVLLYDEQQTDLYNERMKKLILDDV